MLKRTGRTNAGHEKYAESIGKRASPSSPKSLKIR
jgi:hypothetical protein